MKGATSYLSLMAVLSPATSSAVVALWRLGGVSKGVHGIVRSWRTSRQAKASDLEARAPVVGITVGGGGVVRRQGRRRHWYSPSEASMASGCSSEHCKGVKARRKGSVEADHGGGARVGTITSAWELGHAGGMGQWG